MGELARSLYNVHYTHEEKKIVMGVGTKVMGVSKCYDSLQAGSYMYMYSKLLLARTVYTCTVFKRLLILFVT